MKKFSAIKTRIREFANKQGIRISDIYANTGIVDGTFSNSSGITEDNLLKLFSHYKQIDANWLITGEGNMLRDQSFAPNDSNILSVDLQNKLIAMQEKEIARLEMELADTKSRQKADHGAKRPTVTGMAPPEEKLTK